jgi:hypothetical protein
MALAGDEKRIQALFSELSLGDQTHAPRFEKLWRAGELAPRPRPFSRPLVAIVASIIITVAGLLVLWTSTEPSAVAPGQRQPSAPSSPSGYSSLTSPPPKQQKELAAIPRRRHTHPNRLVTRQKQIDRALQQQAALLANWQSPTDKFMASPTASVFKSLPQLNQSAKDLESFLPKNNESIKESNR